MNTIFYLPWEQDFLTRALTAFLRENNQSFAFYQFDPWKKDFVYSLFGRVDVMSRTQKVVLLNGPEFSHNEKYIGLEKPGNVCSIPDDTVGNSVFPRLSTYLGVRFDDVWQAAHFAGKPMKDFVSEAFPVDKIIELHEKVFASEYGADTLEKVREGVKNAPVGEGVYMFQKAKTDYSHLDLLVRYAEALALEAGEKPRALIVSDGNTLEVLGSEKAVNSLHGKILCEFPDGLIEGPHPVREAGRLAAKPFRYRLEWDLSGNQSDVSKLFV